MEDYTILKKKISYFKTNEISVHVTLNQEITLQNGVVRNKIHNGMILEFQGDMIVLLDEVKGSIPIYLMEIKDIEKRRAKE